MSDFLYHLLDGLCTGTVIALIALGYTLVYGIIKLINFAHGEFYMVGAYAGYYVFASTPLANASPWLAIPTMLLVAGAAGALIAVLTERIAYRPIRDSNRLIPLLTAIGVSFLLQNIFRFVNHGNNLSIPDTSPVYAVFSHSTFRIHTAKFAFIALTIIMMVAFWYVIMHTRFGRAMRATSQDMEAASLMGINVDRVIAYTFAVGGFFAGVTGMLMGATYHVNFMMGFMPGLMAFIAAVIGGIGSIPGAVIGGLLIGVLPNLALWAGVPSDYKDVSCFVLLIVVLVVRPQGLMGRPEREKV